MGRFAVGLGRGIQTGDAMISKLASNAAIAVASDYLLRFDEQVVGSDVSQLAHFFDSFAREATKKIEAELTETKNKLSECVKGRMAAETSLTFAQANANSQSALKGEYNKRMMEAQADADRERDRRRSDEAALQHYANLLDQAQARIDKYISALKKQAIYEARCRSTIDGTVPHGLCVFVGGIPFDIVSSDGRVEAVECYSPEFDGAKP